MRTTFRAALTLAAALAAAPFAAASAQTTACYVPISGTIYVTGQPNSPSACLSGHAAIVLGGGGGGIVSPVATETPGLVMENQGSGLAAYFKNSNTNGGSTTGGYPAFSVENASSTAAARFSSTGINGSAIFAVTDNGGGSTVSILKSNAASTGVALRVNQEGTAPAIFARNLNTTAGNALNIEALGNQATARIVNLGDANGSAINAEAKGSNNTARIANVGTTGGALYAESNNVGSTIFVKNLAAATGGGNAMGLESQAQWTTFSATNTGSGGAAFFKSVNGENGPTVNIRNENATSSNGALDVTSLGTTNTVALRVTGNSNYTAADFRNNGTTGGALNLYSNNPQNTGSTLNVHNDGGQALNVYSNFAGDASAMGVSSKGNWAAANFNNSGTGGALWANTNNMATALGAENLGGGGALSGHNNAPDRATAGFENSGTGNALWAKSAGNTVRIESTATGNFIALSASGSGTYPTAQFDHTSPTTGTALRVMGGMDVNQGMFYANAGATVNGNLQINGNYAATGTKTAIVPTSTGMRKMYTEEATEVWFTDYGFGKLEAGEVFVPLEGTFSETINTAAPYHVFLQSYGDAELVVTKRTAQGFVVKARNGEAGSEFSYRVVARRKGHEGDRMQQAQKQ